MSEQLSHLTGQGEVHMVEVGDRAITKREATAMGSLVMSTSTLELVLSGETSKGDLMAVARVAAIQAAKRTSELIPLCHPLPLSGIDVSIEPDPSLPGLTVRVSCRTTGQTGVEMEAMTSVSIGLVTLYDMLKSVEPGMTINRIQLMHKDGGRHGSWSC
ncbi:molybdenum cofactor biosynthesis protein C [Synechococcus sp. BIOS-U3-1]|uniref:cyclic pyranopterin monophosphate synthase MoaC n=1 Tax=Synechococcus sp. BIOS-U3-1 TaxID=1400865 RepID=UPI001644DAB5|nr:cyclic pyranopterin monophosphate synthase MoaC [Synechococcus sp. BIOS-U3-1]QNI60272.1 molybdenum cofactor biosynthesis protein C [Synechococcus sp. BIOS-U3-1]